MCGIVGYIGPKNAAAVLMQGLHRLEYRGYDSAGVAVLNGGVIDLRRSPVPAPFSEEHSVVLSAVEGWIQGTLGRWSHL